MIGIEKPSYIDIGANHPLRISNTALFYEHGCRGINIEPNPSLIGDFYAMRPEDRNLCCGVGSESGFMPFYVVRASGLSSFDRSVIEKRARENPNDPNILITKTIDVPIRTLEEIIRTENNGIMPDYMDLDVESWEYEVLRTYDLRNKGPVIMQVETVSREVIRLIEKQGYWNFLRVNADFFFIKDKYKTMFI